MKITTDRGTIEHKLIDGLSHWEIDDEYTLINFAKSIFPVEYHYIKCTEIMNRINSKNDKSALDEHILERTKSQMSGIVRDAECEVKWGARMDLSIFDEQI